MGSRLEVEIWPGSKFYIPWSAKDAIVRKIQDVDKKNRWKILVRENIRLVYGKNIRQFSARGSKINSRPPMNILLFKGLQDWAQSVSDTPIKEKEFIGYINKLASNARRDLNEIKEKKCKRGNETKKTDDSDDEQSAEAVDIRPDSSPTAVLMHHVFSF